MPQIEKVAHITDLSVDRTNQYWITAAIATTIVLIT